MAAIILAAGAPGKRFSLPNARIAIHQPSIEGLEGQATDVNIQAKEMLRIRQVLSNILADVTGQPFERIDRDVERDFILRPKQALEYGLIDQVLTYRDENPERVSKLGVVDDTKE